MIVPSDRKESLITMKSTVVNMSQLSVRLPLSQNEKLCFFFIL